MSLCRRLVNPEVRHELRATVHHRAYIVKTSSFSVYLVFISCGSFAAAGLQFALDTGRIYTRSIRPQHLLQM